MAKPQKRTIQLSRLYHLLSENSTHFTNRFFQTFPQYTTRETLKINVSLHDSKQKRQLFEAELLVELINTSAGIYQFLLACIKGVTLRADFNLYVLLCASRLNNLTASAPNSGLLIVGMDPFLHYVHLFRHFYFRKADCTIYYFKMQQFYCLFLEIFLLIVHC